MVWARLQLTEAEGTFGSQDARQSDGPTMDLMDLSREPLRFGEEAMSQQQPPRVGLQRVGPGDVYPVHGGPAARVQREEALSGHRDPGEPGFVVTETDLPGQRLITTVSGGQVVSQFAVPAPSEAKGAGDGVTIGQALEAAGMMAGDRPVGRGAGGGGEGHGARRSSRRWTGVGGGCGGRGERPGGERGSEGENRGRARGRGGAATGGQGGDEGGRGTGEGDRDQEEGGVAAA
ncbi:unnamed protein product, partial [Musa banksii]